MPIARGIGIYGLGLVDWTGVSCFVKGNLPEMRKKRDAWRLDLFL